MHENLFYMTLKLVYTSFGLNYQNGCEMFWTYGFLKLNKDDEIIWYFLFPNNCCHSLSVCTGYMGLYLCSHSIFVLTCKYYTLCVNVFHFWHWILVTIAFQTLVLDKFTLALNWQWKSLLLWKSPSWHMTFHDFEIFPPRNFLKLLFRNNCAESKGKCFAHPSYKCRQYKWAVFFIN